MEPECRLRRSAIRLAACAFAVAAALPPPARALDPAHRITQYIQASWTSETGLPQNSVHAIAQTTDGYLWLGTEEGLARFDGIQFTLYSRENDENLASDYIQALVAGPNGSLWIGTDSGLTHYTPDPANPRGGQFHSFTVADGLAANSITALCGGRDGSLWVGTSRGLNRITGGRIENWTSGRGLASPSVTALTLDAAGTLWVGTDKGLSHLVHHRFVTFTTTEGLPGNVISALTLAPDGSLWIGTLSHGIVQIRLGRVSLPAISLPWPEIGGLFADPNGAIWIVFDRHGIGRLSGGHLEIYGAAQGLPSDRCTHTVFQDREGDLWIGLLDAGVVEFRETKFAVFGKSEGLSGNYVGNVLQAQDGTMWIGADSNGLNHLLSDGRVEVWDHRRGLPNQAVYSMAQTRDGSIWVGYRRGALARIRDGRVSVFHDPQAPDTSLNALFQDSRGRLWVGLFGKGLAQFENASFHHVTLTGRVVDLAQSPDGSLWIATDGDGLQRLDGDSLTRLTVADGLPSDHVMCVFADRQGNIWIGTASGGLSLLRNRKVVSWKTRQGLPASTIGSILEDNSGDLWMGADNGIFRVSMQELLDAARDPDARIHPVLYGTADGLRSRETLYGSTPCAWKDRAGRLWFATIRGAAVIDPAHIPSNPFPPPVSIQSLTFDARPVALRDGVRLGPGSGNLEVTFTAPSFVAPQSVQYRYRLAGFEDNWTEAGSRRTVWYTNLPPGSYTFQVQAANSDGVWNRTGAAFSFRLMPPIGRTPLAYALYGLLALLVTWAIITLRTRHLTRRQRELTRIVAERTAQLEAEKAALEETRRELQIQATHDSLTGLYNRAAMLEHLHREIARAARENSTLGVLIADLDHFKRVNDLYGHPCGDDIIRDTAVRFRAAMRDYDIVGRYGGEEFLILLPNFDFQRSPNRVEDLLEAIRARPFSTENADIALTCSIGVGTWRGSGDSPDTRDVIARADAALYLAKNSGRNCARFEVR
ncbi:MAG TPA: two-component regulator propeller domain-containing protein, partial [Acidobacteriaceae bacterium]|nr:two-component regulator propeller domain-containing protein [Acidobacteriaceae bacterium]